MINELPVDINRGILVFCGVVLVSHMLAAMVGISSGVCASKEDRSWVSGSAMLVRTSGLGFVCAGVVEEEKSCS